MFPRNGIYFSFSVWQDVEAMLTFSQSGPHRKVLSVSNRLAAVHAFHHFPCIAVPSQEQALKIWQQNQSAP